MVPFGLGGGRRIGYPKTLTENDFTTVDHQVLTSTIEWTTIATYKCPAQQQIAVGYGVPNLSENEGRLYVYLRTGEATPVEISGKVRIIVTDYNETKIFPLFEHDEELLHGDLNDKQKLIPLPEKRPMVGEDSYIKIQVKPTTAHATAGVDADNLGWADATESLIKLPVTVYE